MRTKYLTPRISESISAVIARATETEEKDSFSGAVKRLVADGLKYRMLNHTEFPLDQSFMDAIETVEGVCDLWNEFEDAMATEAGLKGICENQYRFEASKSTKGAFVILRKNEIQGPDGTIYLKK